MEGYVLGDAGHHECLSQVGSVYEVILQPRHAATVTFQRHRLRLASLLRFKLRLHAQHAEDISGDRVALLRAVHQSCKPYLRICVRTEGQQFIPVARTAPVALDIVVAPLIGLRLHGDGVAACPFCVGSEFAHHPQSQVDIWSRDNLAHQSERKPFLQHRTDHQQCRDILRTHVALNFQQSALQLSARDAEWGIALFACIADVGTQFPQCVHQDADRPVLHALRTRQYVRAWCHTQVGRHKSHGGSCRLDIDLLGHLLQGTDNHLRIVAVAQVLGQMLSAAERIDDQGTV